MLLDKIKTIPNAHCVGEMVKGRRGGRGDRMVGKDSWDMLSQVLRNRWKRSEEAAEGKKEER